MAATQPAPVLGRCHCWLRGFVQRTQLSKKEKGWCGGNCPGKGETNISFVTGPEIALSSPECESHVARWGERWVPICQQSCFRVTLKIYECLHSPSSNQILLRVGEPHALEGKQSSDVFTQSGLAGEHCCLSTSKAAAKALELQGVLGETLLPGCLAAAVH